MLKSLRDGAKGGFLKFILLGFMAMAVGGLVLTDVGGFFRGGISTNFVAKGSGVEISTQQFDRTVRRILSRQGMSPQEAYNLGAINQILQGEIQTQILTLEAQKLGLNVSDETVKQQISKLAEPLARDGVSKSDALRQVLRAQGVSEGEFVGSIRQEMAITLYRNALVGGTANLSSDQASDLYQYQNETRNFEGFVLTNASVKDINDPSDESLKRYYEANKNDFLIAERRDLTIATLKEEMLSKTIEISEEDLQDAYDDNISAYEKPEQRKVEQAILSTQNDAQNVLDRVNKGKSLKKAVKEVTGKETAYVGENDFTESGLLEDVAKPVFEAAEPVVIGPVQTALGFHVLNLKEIIAPQTESFDKVKDALKKDLTQERLADELIDAANKLDDQLAGGAPLDEVVTEMGLTTETFKNLNQAGMNKDGKDVLAAYQGDIADILDAGFDYLEGEASPVMELDDGRFITVHVDKVTERSFTEFDTVKADLLKRWKNEQRRLSNQGRAEDILAKVKSGTLLKDAAKEMGVSVKTFNNLKRDGEAKSPLTMISVRQIFDKDQGDAIKLTNPEGYVIGQVTDISLPNSEKADKAIATLKKQAAESMPQEVLAQYINALGAKYNVKVNDRVLQMVYGDTAQN